MKYPTPEHQNAAEAIVDFFSTFPEVDTICLTCSCARGKASRDSCLDMLVLGLPEIMSTAQPNLEKAWEEFYFLSFAMRSERAKVLPYLFT